jgi:hypothetical protein
VFVTILEKQVEHYQTEKDGREALGDDPVVGFYFCRKKIIHTAKTRQRALRSETLAVPLIRLTLSQYF